MSSPNTFSQRYSTLITLRKRLISCLQTKYASSYLDQLDLSDLGVLADVISSSDDVELSASEERMFEVFQRSVIEAERDFKVVKTLSTTNFSSIKLVTPRGVPANGGKKKKYILKSCRKQFAYKLRHQNSLWNERSLLSSLTSYSAYIPTLYASLQSPTSLHFIMEYIPGGDLETLLNACAEGVGIEEDWVRFWIGELVEVLGWLHERSWVHRDIKPSNILLSSSSHIFLTDFGSSAPLLQEGKVPREACIVPIGTCDYIAPEILKWHEVVVSGEEADEEESEIGGYGAEVDWWSTGVMAYELLTTQTPFFHDSVNETYRMITAHKNNDISFPETTKGRISPISRSFVNGLLKDHPRRLSYSRIKNHPFLAGVPWGSIHPVPSGTPISHPPPLEPSFSVSPSIMMSTAKKPFGFGFGSSNFDFTSFLSSPGMSVLRPRDEDADADGSMEQKKRELIEQERDFWTGFTWYGEGFGWMDGPSQNLEAEGEEDDEDEDEVDENLQRFITPAKPPRRGGAGGREATQSHSSRKVRGISEMEAWKEMTEIAWEIGMTAKKKKWEGRRGGESGNVKTPSRLREVHQTDDDSQEEETIIAGDTLTQLEKRHERILEDVEEIERKYKRLFEMVDKPR